MAIIHEVELKEEYTSMCWWTLELAIKYANEWTKIEGIYWTAIKGKPVNSNMPEDCWAMTNKFDPRVKAFSREQESRNVCY